ncbi:MAG: twitching motility protein PilT [Chloroflexi bacterium]|nr:MAG: twitching motility protein PilT [Chloroflexota bacterium]
MKCATFHFHGELNFFLPRRHKHNPIEHPFDWRGSIKDMIESLGVPHAEIEWLVVNGVSVDFDYIMQDQDVVDVYAFPDEIDIEPKVALRPPFPGRPRFVLDTHLGRLAAYLRMMGFDTLYRNDYPDEELAEVSHNERRILLTRDTGLLKRSIVTYGYYVRNMNPQERLAEIVERFGLAAHVEPFKHCMKCNGLLHPVEKHAVVEQLPRNTAAHYDIFHQCSSCERVYWKGPHFEKMESLMNSVLNGHNHDE